jgi:pimeloyl-ACP methyl ester carboxylesterase
VYWLRGNILSSQRFYKENVVSLTGEQKWAAKYVTVPTAYAAFPYDLSPPQPRELLQYGFNVSQITYFPDGGHFAALEMPTELANDFAKFANSIYQ